MIVPVRPDANGNICIFYEGDENVTQVIFENPDSDLKWSLRYLRRGDKRPYSVPLEEADGELIWTVSLADTEKPGTGYAQLVGSAEGQTKHGRPFTVTVYKSLEKPGDVPSAEKAFGDAVAADAAKAKQAAEDAAKVYANVRQDLDEGKLKGEKGDPGKDAPQIDDGAISRDNPWSSRRIIDTLCPPIAESGNPVTCYPVAGYPLGVKVSWEPTQAGSGEPSPENIRPISGREAVKVERCGENLLKIKSLRTSTTKGGCTWTINDDGSITVAGKAEGGASFLGSAVTNLDKSRLQFLPAGSYFIGGKGANVSIYYYGFYTDGMPYSQIIANRSVKIEKDVWITVQGSVAKGKNVNETVYPYIVPGTTAPTAYTPYQGDTLDLQLPGTVYGGAVDAVMGDGTSKWGLVTLDGTEAWTVSGKFLADKSDWYYVAPKIPGAVNGSPQKGNEICSHYPHADVANNNTVKGCAIVWGAIRVRWGNTIPDNADGWKSYLAAQAAAGTPVQIAYKLAQPTPIQATGAQPIPALEGCNTVLTDADSVTVTGRADPAHAIAALQAQLATATQQLAETQQAIVDTTAMAVDYIFEQDSQIIGGDDDDDQTDTEPVDVPGV